MNSQRFGNENLTSKLLLKIIKEYRGFLINNKVTILDNVLDLNLGSKSATNNLFKDLSNMFAIEDLTGLNNDNHSEKELNKIKDNYIFELLDNTTGAFFLKDILGNSKLFDLENKIASKYFTIVHNEKNTSVSLKTKTNDIITANQMIQPLDARYNNQPDTDYYTKEKSLITPPAEGEENEEFSITGNFADPVWHRPDIYTNKNKKEPSIKYPSLGAIVIKDRRIGLPSKNADHLNIFFNGIPSIELSRCTPYISIAVVTRSEENKPKNINLVTFMRFIKKDPNSKELVLDENIGIRKGTPVGFNDVFESGHNIMDDKDISLMDIFTSSQMMSNANINKNPNPDDLNNSIYGQKVLEPISPLLSLSSLSIDISGMGVALFSSKVGTLSLKLHDRSRLADISHLVAANQFGSTKMVIEFGWSHPEGSPLSDNIIGQYLNCLRDRGIYTVKASSFSFSEGNSVDISIGLACYGAQTAKSIPSAAGIQIPLNTFRESLNKINTIVQKEFIKENPEKKSSELKEVRHLMRLEAKNSISSNHLISYNDYIKLLEEFEKAQKTKGTTKAKKKNLLDAYSGLLKLNKAVNANKINIEGYTEQVEKDLDNIRLKHEKNVTELIYGKLYALNNEFLPFNTTTKRTGDLMLSRGASEIDSLRIVNTGQSLGEEASMNMAQLKDYIARKEKEKKDLQAFADSAGTKTFIEFNESSKVYESQLYSLNSIEALSKNKRRFNSMGRIMMSFIGHPLAMSGMFDEVQMIFYPLNEKAGNARSHTTASMPIEYEKFKYKLSKKLAENVKLSVSSFFSFFEKEIIRDKNLAVYGISDVANEQRKSLKEKEAAKINNSQAIREINEKLEKDIATQNLVYLRTKATILDIDTSGITEDSLLQLHITTSMNENQRKEAEEEAKKIRELASAGIKKRLNKLEKEKKDLSSAISDLNDSIELEVSAKLKEYYSKDGGPSVEPNFATPNISLFFETLTARNPEHQKTNTDIVQQLISGITDVGKSINDNFDKSLNGDKRKTICRVHIYDEKSSIDPRRQLVQSMITEGNGGKLVTRSLKGNVNKDGSIVRQTKLSGKLNEFIATATASKIRAYIKQGYPSITYGANNSTVQGFNVSSNVSDNVSQVIQIASYANRNNPQNQDNAISNFEDITVVPATVTFSMFGMPFIFRGNQIYIDFGTNTTLDNVYTVKTVQHTIENGKFVTNVSLIFAGQGDARSILGDIKRTVLSLSSK